MPIITSLLDNDLYKFTMLQVFHHYERNTNSKYEFRCRTPNTDLKDSINRINEEVDNLCNLKFTKDELDYINSLSFIKPEFIEFLKNLKLNRDNIKINLDENDDLQINIHGLITEVSLFEVPVLAIISEIYCKNQLREEDTYKNGMVRLEQKINRLISSNKKILFSDFGTRRRYSKEWQKNVVKKIIDSKYKYFIGTSNVYLAKKHGIKPIGTMAHEWIMAHAGVTRIDKSDQLALQRWLDFYKGDLGIALTDTYTTDHFLYGFNNDIASSFSGIRHDSGDWKKWAYKFIDHYKRLGIDPTTKTFLFSDGLDFNLTEKIYDELNTKTQVAFGIGTNLTNDVGVKALQIVIKMTECDGFPLIKISDTPGKVICINEKFKEFSLDYFKKFKLS